MSILDVFRHTCALPAEWLTLRELLRVCGASSSLRSLARAYPVRWRAVADRLRRGHPRAWVAQQCALAGFVRRRNVAGAMLRLTPTERRQLSALPLPRIVAALAARLNAPLVAHERAFRNHAVAKASRYPPALCRTCSRFSRVIVWGGRCRNCFGRDDVELSAGDCVALGLRAEHRHGIPYRAVWKGGAQSKRYSLRVLYAHLAALREPNRRTTRRRTIACARVHSLQTFRRYVRSVGVNV